MSKYTNLNIRLIIFFLGLIVTINIIFSSETLPKLFFLIPLIYSILILLFPAFIKYMFQNIGLLALNVCMVIRYLVSPFLISHNGVYYEGVIVPFYGNYTIAIYLMLYELLIIFLVFQSFYKKFYSIKENKITNIQAEKNYTGWFFVLLCLVLIFIYPEILTRYSFIWTADELKSKDIGIDIISFIPLMVQLGILVLTISIVNFLYKKYCKNKKFMYVFLSFGVVFLLSSFILGTSRNSVILPLVTGLYIIFIAYNKYKKIIISISFLGVLLVVLLTTMLKATTLSSNEFNLHDFFSGLNSSLQQYFSGLNNVAISVQTSSIYPSFNFKSILNDLTNNVAVLSSLINSEKSALIDFNITYYNGGLARDQILPLIGQGYLYFGFIFAPILTVIIFILLMYFDSKIITKESLIQRYIYAYVTLKLGTFMMGNFTILLSFITNNFLILILLAKLNHMLFGRRGET